MLRQTLLRILLHPVFVAAAVGLPLLVANLVPRVQCGFPVFLDPSSTSTVPCNGLQRFGWPRTARADEFIQYSNVGPYFRPQFSLNHVWRKEAFYVQTTRRLVLAHAVNAAFAVAAALLVAVGTRAIATRKLSLKSLFAVVTSAGILTAVISWENPLSTHPNEPVHWDVSRSYSILGND